MAMPIDRRLLTALRAVRLLAALLLIPMVAQAQEAPPQRPTLSPGVSSDSGWESRKAYLQDQGTLDDALKIRELLAERAVLHGRTMTDSHYDHLGYLAAGLVIEGYTFDLISRLKDAGLDIVSNRYLIQGERLTAAQWSTLYELTVIATIVDRYDSWLPRDGFLSSLVLEVHEVLIGSVDSKYIIVRLKSGKLPSGNITRSTIDFNGQKGETYAFYLSNRFYRFAVEYFQAFMYPLIIDPAFVARDPDRNRRYYLRGASRLQGNAKGTLDLAEVDKMRRIGTLIRSHTQ